MHGKYRRQPHLHKLWGLGSCYYNDLFIFVITVIVLLCYSCGRPCTSSSNKLWDFSRNVFLVIMDHDHCIPARKPGEKVLQGP